MGIIDRLADLVRSYLLEDEDEYDRKPSGQRFKDPDAAVAYDELNEYLRGEPRGNASSGVSGDSASASSASSASSSGGGAASSGASRVPPAIARDFAELGLDPASSPDTCKAAYKKLLKIHHPDRHAGHAGNMRKATEKSARINAAFDRIERWRKTGRVD
jgi:DnaJ-domain-containing protein 1